MSTSSPPRIYTSNEDLFRHFSDIAGGDIFVGRLRFRAGEEGLLFDLAQRGLRAIPSMLSQLLSRSKALQASLLRQFMPPSTYAVHDLHDLRAVLRLEHEKGAWLTKLNGKNGGTGVCFWSSLEAVHTAAVLGQLPYSFVLQRFLEGKLRDIRTIVIGDYVEAYQRSSSASFRHNLHFGGRSSPVELSPEELDLCRAVMERGGFPYAHVDLLVTEGGVFCSEINLRGGLHGARITADEYRQRIEGRHRELVAKGCGAIPR